MQLNTISDITNRYRHIFLSPHFDDVVYSCGGTLSAQVSSGLRPLVITVFAGIPSANQSISPLATQVMREMGDADPIHLIETRRNEEKAAADLLGVDYLWLDYQEAIYRGQNYTTKEQFMGGDVHSSDTKIERELTQVLLNLRDRLPDTSWYTPLGVGRHVDHQIVCSAADHLARSGSKVYFYEDFPYVQRESGALEKRLQELGGEYEYALVEISEVFDLKLEAANKYQTQVAANFGSPEAMHKAFDSYTHGIRPVETIRLERFWTVR